MIRKAIIALLASLAFATVGAWVLASESDQPIPVHSYDSDKWSITWFLCKPPAVLSVDFRHDSGDPNNRPTTALHNYERPISQSARDLGPWLGFIYEQLSNVYPDRIYRSAHIVVPLWMPLVVFGSYPAIAFIRGPLRRWRRRKRGLCIRCGYDLEGNISGTCPECGEGL